MTCSVPFNVRSAVRSAWNVIVALIANVWSTSCDLAESAVSLIRLGGR